MKKICKLLLIALVLIVSALPISALATPVTETDIEVLPFYDVKSSDWFYYSVKNSYDLGLVNGKTSTRFEPESNMSYAEAIKLAACMNQLYSTGKISLSNGDPWYQSYVDYAVKHGIWAYASIDYNQNITREAYASIFAKALPDTALKPINTVADNAIPDYKTTDLYGSEVYKLYRAGVLTGSDDKGSFLPRNTITRAEVSAVVSRMMIEKQRVRFSNLTEAQVGEWVYGGYEAEPPHREYEVLMIDGVKSDKVRYTGTYKDYGTQFRLLYQTPDMYYDYSYVGMNLHFANRSDKVIKYLTVYVTPYNRVNDALATTQAVEFTGPFYKPTMNTDWSSDYYCWYDGYYRYTRITDGGRYYKDGGYQTITEQQISGVFQVYHADDLWYDYYRQINYLWISAVKIQYMDGTSAYYSGNNLKACIW
jgi:hypothetical protein